MFDELIAAILGACIGSFLNVCICRIPKKQSVIYTPSHCPCCGRKLGAADLVPVFSYLLLKGRCRYCKAKISPRYPLVELLTAVLFLAAYSFWGWHWQTVSMVVFFSLLVSVSVIDIYYQIIPDRILLAGSIIGLPFIMLSSFDKLINGAVGFFAAGLLMLAIALASKGGMGGGDIKLSAVMGLFLGWQNVLVALFIAFLTGGLSGAFLLAAGLKERRDAVPFGPYLALGGLIAAFGGSEIINWYVSVCGL
ncbi:leader peptidase (prepilin peptidase)/N-methyltransferase [Desulfohalotomaculum tongense]|uniref:prepilin peptidase n=1 Tax=Desulforadius tongensis TaxID=1216062 RepID=UPI001957B321|nr:A24 family peptidase [Desulforadius tongensis]MBM7854500.1 leader peptidase (prepilin peptidase)/N-methyltransferase [Desulforadius tongensis]